MPIRLPGHWAARCRSMRCVTVFIPPVRKRNCSTTFAISTPWARYSKSGRYPPPMGCSRCIAKPPWLIPKTVVACCCLKPWSCWRKISRFIPAPAATSGVTMAFSLAFLWPIPRRCCWSTLIKMAGLSMPILPRYVFIIIPMRKCAPNIPGK